MSKLQIVLNSLAGCCIRVFYVNVTALLLYSVTALLKFLTALLEYLDFFNGIIQSADFPTVKAL